MIRTALFIALLLTAPSWAQKAPESAIPTTTDIADWDILLSIPNTPVGLVDLVALNKPCPPNTHVNGRVDAPEARFIVCVSDAPKEQPK